MADILIVEDDPAVSMTLALIVEADGHQSRIAPNGAAGLELLRERIPDLTVTDIEMPVRDGPSMALQMFLEDHGLERVPIVLLSGFPDIGDIARDVGTPYYLSKPFDIDRLREIVERALRERVFPVPQPRQKTESS